MFGIWNITQNKWTYGTCILEFSRNCSSDPQKQTDLHSNLNHVYVQVATTTQPNPNLTQPQPLT